MELKNKIRTRRLYLGLTLEEVANKVGVAKSTVKKWESGQIESMRQTKIAALAAVLNVKPTYLIFDDEHLNYDCEVNNGIIGHELHNNTINIGGTTTRELTEIESEICRICATLTIQEKNELLSFAYGLKSNTEKK